MKYGVKLNPSNLQAHLDIEADLHRINTGIINFVLKVNRGNLVDYVIYENLSARNTQLTVAPTDRETSG